MRGASPTILARFLLPNVLRTFPRAHAIARRGIHRGRLMSDGLDNADATVPPWGSLKRARPESPPCIPGRSGGDPTMGIEAPEGHLEGQKSVRGARPPKLRKDSIDLRVGQELDLPRTPATLAVALTEKERRICDLLADVTKHLAEEHPDLEPVTLRIAGGWVRDKLLGIESHDIDVAIDTMKGFDFAEHVNAYLSKKGYEAKHIGKIAANPDKSKHLETATVRIFDYDLDFVNLRSETYTEHSRVPIIDHATPEEDALRRDITINALFYNIHTREIEDLTGKGLMDLAEGRIRTPLPAIQTFVDDPLRVLRVIRFASRYNYSMADDIPEAIHDESIRRALKVKISKERIGEEMRKMLKTKHPLRAIRFFHRLDLFPIIFLPPPEVADPAPDNGLLAAEYLYTFLSSRASLSDELKKVRDSIDVTEAAHLFLAAELLPFAGLTYLEKKKEVAAVRFVVKDSLKLSNVEADMVCALQENTGRVADVANAVAAGDDDRVKIGSLVRELGTRPLMDRWPIAVVMAMIAECVRVHPEGDDAFDFAVPVLAKYEHLLATVERLGLGGAWELKPIVDGQKVLLALQMKPGPRLKAILDDLIKWQLANPAADEEAATSWLVETFAEKG
ncbi:hypothetical protein DFJ74DRAFT_664922 [Hyaloraphidium curvatum]|nr:hypothetical protein DFJ74DRAFT_664922 [Hyaloraphidium curvatum]